MYLVACQDACSVHSISNMGLRLILVRFPVYFDMHHVIFGQRHHEIFYGEEWVYYLLVHKMTAK